MLIRPLPAGRRPTTPGNRKVPLSEISETAPFLAREMFAKGTAEPARIRVVHLFPQSNAGVVDPDIAYAEVISSQNDGGI